MLPLRYARQWRAASILLLLTVLVATLMPAVWLWSSGSSLGGWFVHADKWLHGLTFLILALWFAGQYPRRHYWRIGLALMVFGAFIELCQRMVSYRTADWLDIGADLGGIGVGLLIGLAGLGGWSLQFENWIQRRGNLGE